MDKHDQLQSDGMWFNARANYGVIMYASEAAALAGAKVCQERDLEWEASNAAQ